VLSPPNPRRVEREYIVIKRQPTIWYALHFPATVGNMRAAVLKQASNLVARAPFTLDSCSPPNCRPYHRPGSGGTRQDEALKNALSAVRHSSSSEAREKKRAEDRVIAVDPNKLCCRYLTPIQGLYCICLRSVSYPS